MARAKKATKSFVVFNEDTGTCMGVYRGSTALKALDAMARDAGYKSYADAVRKTGSAPLVAVPGVRCRAKR